MTANPFAILTASAMLGVSLLAAPASAEPVSVNRGTGQGFVFEHRENCYVMLPRHVHGRSSRLTLLSAAPSEVGEAVVLPMFRSGADLSLGFVESGLRTRCTDRWDDLPADTDAILSGGGAAVLLRVSPSGILDRLPMEITSVDLDTLRARPSDPARGEDVFQGTSGAVLLVGTEVVGMAIEASDTRDATFLRIDRIKVEFARLLQARAENLARADDAQAEESEATASASDALCPPSGVAIADLSCSVEPASPERACSALLSPGGAGALFPAGSGAVEIVAELAGPEPQPVGRVVLASRAAETEAEAGPKSVRVEVDASSSRPRWRAFAARDVPPNGTVAMENGARPFARRVRVTVLDSWEPDKPLRLDCLSVEP